MSKRAPVSTDERVLPAIAFGPVPSRRLGRSLGINHLPSKACTYSCVYCQVGRTSRLRCGRCAFLGVDTVVAAVERKLDAARRAGQAVDYLTFVPEGEPTLDVRLGSMIDGLRARGLPIGVVTNGSLLARADVRSALAGADWVSLKVDAVDRARWRQVNRPHGRLRLGEILDGMERFVADFRGRVVTETMLLAEVNDAEAELRDVASFIGVLRPLAAYLSVPTRPPAEPWVRPATPATLARAYEVFRALAGPAELLVGYEGNGFSGTGDAREDLLAIAAVHPMREPAVRRFLALAGAAPGLASELVAGGELVEATYGGHHYYLRPAAPAPSAAGGEGAETVAGVGRHRRRGR